jgi:hypothetical protein
MRRAHAILGAATGALAGAVVVFSEVQILGSTSADCISCVDHWFVRVAGVTVMSGEGHFSDWWWWAALIGAITICALIGVCIALLWSSRRDRRRVEPKPTAPTA